MLAFWAVAACQCPRQQNSACDCVTNARSHERRNGFDRVADREVGRAPHDVDRREGQRQLDPLGAIAAPRFRIGFGHEHRSASHVYQLPATQFKQILEPDGSLVIDIGGAWTKGIPAKSTYHLKLLLKLVEHGCYVAQDFYHYHSARLPTPAEWVTVHRLRVKDAINNVWWLTLDPFVPVNNRSVLLPYSDSMKSLLKNGYKPALKPSGHGISDKFQRDNGGSIPPSLLTFANTESNSYYLRRCKEEGIKPHPARLPQALPEFFINFLTKPGDLVIDPFAGSKLTGVAAESLGRRWISVELDEMYARASKFRFENGTGNSTERRATGIAKAAAAQLAAAFD
jgi:hypothetical protein